MAVLRNWSVCYFPAWACMVILAKEENADPDDLTYQPPSDALAEGSCIVGEVYGDTDTERPMGRKFDDGAVIHTSQLEKLTASSVKTRNNTYQLENPDPRWLDWLKRSNLKLEDYFSG